MKLIRTGQLKPIDPVHRRYGLKAFKMLIIPSLFTTLIWYFYLRVAEEQLPFVETVTKPLEPPTVSEVTISESETLHFWARVAQWFNLPTVFIFTVSLLATFVVGYLLWYLVSNRNKSIVQRGKTRVRQNSNSSKKQGNNTTRASSEASRGSR